MPRHCWLRLRRHRSDGSRREGWRWWWTRCAVCDVAYTTAETGRFIGPG